MSNPESNLHSESSVPTDAGVDERGDSPQGESFTIVGIGASAGGLEAFTQLLKALPQDTGMAFVLVQHLDPVHESALTQILSRATSLPVNEIIDHQPVQPNHIYVIPPDTNLSIEQGILKITPRERARMPHRPIDSFFESLSQDQRDRAIGVVLSGTASDGTLGLEAIKAEGGITFAQDDSAKHDSMPRSAVAAGCVDLVLSPANIAGELARIAKHPYANGSSFSVPTAPEDVRAEATAHEIDDTPLPSGGSPSEEPFPGEKSSRPPVRRSSRAAVNREKDAAASANSESGREAEQGYQKILLLLRSQSGVDFSLYKSTTIQRRINRRMILTKHNTLTDYAAFLRGNAKELDSLYSDVLISVTSFFRNPEMFDALQLTVFPELLKQRGDDPLRCWVLGCSTGQEAYSIAMAFVEAAENAPRPRTLQIFATDLNEALLQKARHGLYAKSLADDITPERLRRFFVEEQGGYRICKPLREMVVFARQNLIADPPFSRMDLISCRNLLIYLEPMLQKKALPTFHYALKSNGFLLLGASESIGGFTELFEPVDKKYKIYAKKPAPTPAFHLPVRREPSDRSASDHRPLIAVQSPERSNSPDALRGELNAQREADRITINQYAPPGVLVNEALQVLQFRGPTGAFLEPPAGKASFDVLKMAREGLMIPLRAAINQAKQENKSARKENVRVQRDGQVRTVNLAVIPLKNLRERCFLILFEEADEFGQPGARARAVEPPTAPISKEAEPSRIAELEVDLAETREYLRSMLEQHEAANEELQAANEEVQSANEELQSVNEELETSKEELESANEELITVNEEMSNRNLELNGLNNDLLNLQASTKLAIVLLGRDLTIRRFSPQAEKQFDLRAADVGRPIGHIRHHLSGGPLAASEEATPKSSRQHSDVPTDLESIAGEVIASIRERECEVCDRAGRWYSLRVRPYMTLDNKVDGAVLVLVDIDAIKRSEQIAAAARDFAENTIATVRQPLLVLDKELRVESANNSFYREFRVTAKETIGKRLYDLGDGEWDIPRLRELLGEIIQQDTTIEDFPVDHDVANVGKRIMLINARRLVDSQCESNRILLAIENVTERTRAEGALRESEERYRDLFNSMDEGYCIIDVIFNEHQKPVDYRFVEVNRAFEKQSGMHDVVGKRMLEFVPSIEEHWLANYGHVAMTAEPIRFANEYKTLNRWFDVYAFKVGLRDSRNVAVIFTDITGRIQAERALRDSEERFRTLADNMAQFAWTADAKGWIYWYNQRWFEYTGTRLEGMQGWGWKTVIHPDHVERVVERVQHSWDTGEPWEDTFPLVGKDGTYRWFLSRALPIRDADGNVLRWFGTNTDVTQQREMEQEIQLQAAQLAGESRRKDEFLAMLSHELRNPLAPIRSALHLLKMHERGTENPIQRQAREIIERQTTNLTKLVSDLLEVSRVASGRIHLNLQSVDINQVVQHAVETVTPMVDQRQHQLSLRCGPDMSWVHGDATRLEEILVNVLINAAKYTPDGGRIEVRCERADHANLALVRVRDNGMGIDPELLPRIFDLFTQADRSLARSAGGLGIGLSLAHRLVELHGGTIEAHSPPAGQDVGSEFIVKLPLMETPRGIEQSDTMATETFRDPGSVCVLVVDDNIDMVIMLVSALRTKGYSVQSAHNGADGLKVAQQWRPDVVLLDIGLPGMDGYEVARQLRADPSLGNAGARMRLIALTGYGRDTDIATAKEAGFDAHLVKPCDFEELEKLLAPSPSP